MNAQTFGGFIAVTRKELGLTQAQLAEKIHVTDKAVSRWERGLGFPDIQLLEPLSAALDVTLVELMQSQRIPQVTAEQASSAVADTVEIAKLQEQKQRRRRRILLLAVTASLLSALVLWWLLFTGLFTRSDVYLQDYSVIYREYGDLITIETGVSSSMGYTRDYKDVSHDPTRMELTFYSAYGGPNGTWGASDVFVLQPAAQCTQIWIHHNGEPQLTLEKDPVTGLWTKP